MRGRWLAVAGVAALLVASAWGCATRDPDAESDLPWNMPQTWESAPTLPFMPGQGY